MKHSFGTTFLSILFLLVLFSSAVFAARGTERSSIISPTAAVTAVNTSSDVIPLSVSVKKPLVDIQTSYAAVESARLDQREKYDRLRTRLLDSPSSERSILTAQLSQQRQRVLLSTLNTMVVIFQRSDFVLQQFDETLLRLRSKYLSSKNKKVISDFDSRMRELESAQSSLQKKSSLLSEKLSLAPSSVNLGDDLITIKQDLSSFIRDMKQFTVDYRSLAKDVISSS